MANLQCNVPTCRNPDDTVHTSSQISIMASSLGPRSLRRLSFKWATKGTHDGVSQDLSRASDKK